MNKYRFFSFALMLSFFFLPLSNIQAAATTLTDPPDSLFSFLITVETTSKGVQLTCKEGCDWKELSFASYEELNGERVYGTAIVDQKGVSVPVQDDEIIEGQNTDFLFKIQRTEEGVSLKGIKGMKWISLGFSCNLFSCPQDINEWGMTE